MAELTALLKQNSSNSSRPPSSDPPAAPPSRPRKPSGRRRGGQPGHKKHERRLLPPEQVTATHSLKPEYCRTCSDKLTGEDPAPYRHQVIEVPKVAPLVHEYQLHTLCCRRCRTRTRALLPDGVPHGQFGPRLTALVAVASGTYRMPKRTIQEMLSDLFGIDISLGAISGLEQATSDALAQPVDEVAAAIQHEPIVHADETGWYQRSRRAWLWVVASTQLAYFLISTSRGAKVAKQMLGAFAGVLASDRWSAYAWVDVERRQICWAHLLRQFVGFQDYDGDARWFGRSLERNTKAMFRLWHRVRDGTLSRTDFQRRMKRIKRLVVRDLRACTTVPVAKVAGRAREILQLETAMWTFVDVDRVDPTNNHAERLLRHSVIWRKSSFGTDSENGSRFVGRILTAVASLRLQRRNVLDFLSDACTAALLGHRPPSLLPQAAAQPIALAA